MCLYKLLNSVYYTPRVQLSHHLSSRSKLIHLIVTTQRYLHSITQSIAFMKK